MAARHCSRPIPPLPPQIAHPQSPAPLRARRGAGSCAATTTTVGNALREVFRRDHLWNQERLVPEKALAERPAAPSVTHPPTPYRRVPPAIPGRFLERRVVPYR